MVPRRPSRRRPKRWRSALLEAAVAAAVLGAFAVTAPGAATGPGPSPLGRWAQSGLPSIDALLADTARVEAGALPGAGGAGPTDLALLARDLDAAVRLPPPPDANAAGAWSGALGDLGGGLSALGGADATQRSAGLAALDAGASELEALARSLGP